MSRVIYRKECSRWLPFSSPQGFPNGEKEAKEEGKGVGWREEQGAIGERGDSVEIEFRSNTATAGEREG